MYIKKFYKRDREFVDFLCLVAIFLFITGLNSKLLTNKPGMVLQASTGTNQVRFYYDSQGQRIAKLNPREANTYYLSPNLEVVYNKDGSISWRKNYYFSGKAIAVRNGSTAAVPTSVPTSTSTPTLTPRPTVTTPTPLPTASNTPTPTPTTINYAPIIVSNQLRGGVQHQPYSRELYSTDANVNDPLNMWFTGLPAGYYYTCVSQIWDGVLRRTCTITNPDPGVVNTAVTAYASDGKVTVTKQFTLTIVRP